MSVNTSKIKLAVVSYVVLDNTFSGQKKRIYDLVDGLSSEFEVTYIQISDKNKSPIINNLEKKGVKFTPYKLQYNFIFRLLIQIIYKITFPFFGIKKSILISYWWSFKNRKKIKKWDFDIVISEYFMTSVFFDYLSKKSLRVIDMHDIQYLTLQEQLKKKSSVFNKLQLSNAKNLEINRLKKADVLMAVNRDEIKLLQTTLNSNYIFAPLTINEIDLSYPKSHIGFDTIQLSYFAGLSSDRTYQEIHFILNNIFPTLIAKYGSDINLQIIGSKPSSKLINLIKINPQVNLVGEVNNLNQAFQKIHFAIYHWMGNSYGFRTRIIDVLATGTPIFLNKACVSGMGLDNNNGLFYDLNPGGIIETIEFYKNNKNEYFNLSLQCIETAKKFSSTVVYENLNMQLKTLYTTLKQK